METNDQSHIKNKEVELITYERGVEGNGKVIQDNNKSINMTIIPFRGDRKKHPIFKCIKQFSCL